MNSAMRENEALKAQLKKVYADTAVEHILNPRNTGSLENADASGRIAARDGDAMEIWLKIKDDVITGTGFNTGGCAATIASGSMITELARGKTVSEAQRITPAAVVKALGGLPQGNVHCAELAVNALRKAIDNYLVFKREPWKRAYHIESKD